MQTPLLAAERLSCAAAERVLFDALRLAAAPGDLIEVRGPNGSGKSTLLRCLAGLLAPRRGRVRRHCAIDYVGHKPGMCERLTPVENLRWLARLRGDAALGFDLDQALRRVDLRDARHDLCAALSAGQIRRAALARLTPGAGRVWLLDEPLTALDDDAEQLFGTMIAAHRAAGGAVVCATHRPLPSAPSPTPSASSAHRTVQLGA